MKKLLSMLMCLAMIFSFVSALPASAETTLQTEVGEDGKTYYLIGSADDYLAFVEAANKDLTINGKLTADIDLDGKEVMPIGTHSTTSGNRKHYSGIFDGNGHIVRNLTINATFSGDADNAGFAMFAQLNGATIKNLGIEKAEVTVKNSKDNARLGILGCWVEGSTSITNCCIKNSTLKLDGSKYIQAAGPIAACLGPSATINNCYVIDSVVTATKTVENGGYSAAGFVGYISASTTTANISNSYAKNVTVENYNKIYAFARFGTSSSHVAPEGYTCYSDKTARTNDVPFTIVSDWSTLANTLGDAWKNDTMNLNGGAPRLAWEKDPETYPITIADTVNGTVVASPSTNVEAGESVTLKAKPNDGYKVETLIVDGQAVTSPYTFTMPAKEVSVSATFTACFKGEGTENDPFLISSPDDIFALKAAVDANQHFEGKYFKLTNDIDLISIEFEPIGTVTSSTHLGDNPDTGRYFSGNLDGSGYVVKNISISVSHMSLGLFGVLRGATVTNLGIESSRIRQAWNGDRTIRIGGLAGYAVNSNISGCYAEGVKLIAKEGAKYMGGLIANVSGTTTVTGCYAKDVALSTELTDGTVTNCASGLIGDSNSATLIISNCYTTGIKFSKIQYNKAALTRGRETATITDCYTTSSLGKDESGKITKITIDELKALPEGLESKFFKDLNKVNDGYPNVRSFVNLFLYQEGDAINLLLPEKTSCVVVAAKYVRNGGIVTKAEFKYEIVANPGITNIKELNSFSDITDWSEWEVILWNNFDSVKALLPVQVFE